MKLNETTLADVLHCMAEGRTNYAEVDFKINGFKAKLEIKLKSRGEEK